LEIVCAGDLKMWTLISLPCPVKGVRNKRNAFQTSPETKAPAPISGWHL
jgi:hypothetical protein